MKANVTLNPDGKMKILLLPEGDAETMLLASIGQTYTMTSLDIQLGPKENECKSPLAGTG